MRSLLTLVLAAVQLVTLAYGQSSAVLRAGTVRSKPPLVIRLQPGSARFQRFRPKTDVKPPTAPRALGLPLPAPAPPPQPRVSVPQPLPRRPQPIANPAPPAPRAVAPRPQPVAPRPVAPRPPQVPQIPPQLAQIFGLDQLGIPGLGGPVGPSQRPVSTGGLPQGLRLPPGLNLPPGFQIPPGLLAGGGGSAFGPVGGSQLGIQNGLLSPSSGFNPNVPLPAQFGGGATSPNGGLFGLLGQFAKQLTQNAGIRDIIARARSPNGISVPGLASIPGFKNLPQIPGLSGLVGGGRGPPVAGLPRFRGLNLLQIPRSPDGRVDVVGLMSNIGREITNGSTLADLLPPERLQKFADNVTDVLLPNTPELDLNKFMGRWFEGINSPRATEQRCVVHHYGGLTANGKTATFTALKIYREGSEFGQVRYSIGYAFRGGSKSAMLQMHTSETTDPAPFWVYKLGPEEKDSFGNLQYEWAIVSNWVKYPVTVLVRDPDTFKQKYEKEVLRWLEDQLMINGFIRAFNLLQPASYKNCQYADSTFEVFGK